MIDISVRQLEEPLILDWHLTPEANMEVHRIAALPGGEAVISNNVRTANYVLRLNKDGKFDQKLYTCDPCVAIGALLLLGNDLFVIHTNGTVIQISPQTGQVVNIYTINNVSNAIHTGSLYSNPTDIDSDLLLLADEDRGEVFSYRLSKNSKQVHVRGLRYPKSVTYLFNYNKMHFVVCDANAGMIRVYDKYWIHVRSFKTVPYTFGTPYAVVASSENTLIIAEVLLGGISESTINGKFIKNLISNKSDGMKRPVALSFYYPFLWVASRQPFNHHLPYRYKLIRNMSSTL